MLSPRIALPLATLVLAGCGAIGDLQPPTLDIPLPVTDLRVVERGEKVVIEFTIPELTTEGLALRLARVDLEAGSEALDTTGMKPGPVRLEVAADRWQGKDVPFRVRLVGRKGRDNGWSEPVVLRVVAPLATPSGLKAEAVPSGVKLTWDGSADVSYRVRRNGEIVTTATGREWVDSAARFGEKYEYSLQAAVVSGPVRAESEISPAVAITPEDRFPPAVPKGLTSMVASSSIELAWEPCGESDLGGYSVYRASGGQEFRRVAERVAAPSYSDRDVKPSVIYRYTVSSVDLSGNESERSAPVEAALP
ncbi:MAG TPA: hypothetical protein VLH81_13165 [Desulfobacterales bacterium]|nr:hypothetical protein [Desulfobacterales bacterium]